MPKNRNTAKKTISYNSNLGNNNSLQHQLQQNHLNFRKKNAE